MSRLAYFADFVSMPALALTLILLGGATLPGIAIGLVAWTLAEYVIHWVLFHRLPLFKAGHDEHHAKPSGRTGVTSLHSLLVFGALSLLLSAGVLAGLALGYLAYIAAHHAVHHWRVALGSPSLGAEDPARDAPPRRRGEFRRRQHRVGPGVRDVPTYPVKTRSNLVHPLSL